MDDFVLCYPGVSSAWHVKPEDMPDQAEIERLRAENVKLRAALMPFAACVHGPLVWEFIQNAGPYLEAARALTEKE